MKLLDLVLNKKYLLDRLSQEQIFEYYMGFPVSEGFHKNPLRNDGSPGCKFYYEDDRLIFNDFAWGKKFNCFEYVMEKETLTFHEALRRIADDMIILTPGVKQTPKKETLPKKTTSSVFKITPKLFTPKEFEFWNVGGLEFTQEQLNTGGVYSVQTLWEDEYVNTNLEMVFAYWEDQMLKQIYFPNNKALGKRRFRNKKDFKVGGWSQLRTDCNYVIVTKSFKDMFILKSFGINCIYIVNEKILLSEEYMNTLESMYDFIGFLLDNDYTGKRQLVQYKQKYPHITPMLFDCSEGKDTYDVVKQFGKEYMLELIESVKKRFL